MITKGICFITFVARVNGFTKKNSVPGHPRGCERCRKPDPVDIKHSIKTRETVTTTIAINSLFKHDSVCLWEHVSG